MNSEYVAGFQQKCAELDVSPDELLKSAKLGKILAALDRGGRRAYNAVDRAGSAGGRKAIDAIKRLQGGDYSTIRPRVQAAYDALDRGATAAGRKAWSGTKAVGRGVNDYYSGAFRDIGRGMNPYAASGYKGVITPAEYKAARRLNLSGFGSEPGGYDVLKGTTKLVAPPVAVGMGLESRASHDKGAAVTGMQLKSIKALAAGAGLLGAGGGGYALGRHQQAEADKEKYGILMSKLMRRRQKMTESNLLQNLLGKS